MSTDNHTLYVCGGLVKPDQFINLLRDYQKDLTRQNVRFRDLKFRHNIDFNGEEGVQGYLWVSDEEVFNQLNRENTNISLNEFRDIQRNYYTSLATQKVNDYLIKIIDEQNPGQTFTTEEYVDIIADEIKNDKNWKLIEKLVQDEFKQITEIDYLTYRFSPSFVYNYSADQIEEHENRFIDPTQYFSVAPGEEAGRSIQKYGRCGTDLTLPNTYTGYIETSAVKFNLKRNKTYSMTLFNVPRELTNQVMAEKLSQFGQIESTVRNKSNDVTVKFVNPVVHLAIDKLFKGVLPFYGVNVEFRVNTY